MAITWSSVEANYFLVASRGHMATTWLTNALNRLPDTLAVHGSSPERELINRDDPLGSQLQALAQLRPVKHCGLIHCVNATHILEAVQRDTLANLPVASAQLTRHPIILAEAMACFVERSWSVHSKYSASIPVMQQEKYPWPDNVSAVLSDQAHQQLPRLMGMFWRLSAEASEAWSFEMLKQAAPQHQHPIFKFEDYTSDVASFSQLLQHLLGVSVNSDDLRTAFGSPKVNKHRNDNADDPQHVYETWSGPEQDLFRTMLSDSKLQAFFAHHGLYDMPFADASDALRTRASSDGVTINSQYIQ